jgi:micrococcal nuclease
MLAPFMPRKDPAERPAVPPVAVGPTLPPRPTPSLIRTRPEGGRVAPRSTPGSTVRSEAVPRQDLEPPTETAIVQRVVDGDTLDVVYGGRAESVRLIGIDTPEKRENEKARRDSTRTGRDIATITAAGKAATAFMRAIVAPGERVGLEFDVRRRDKYDRLLAYVYLSDGRMINEEMLRAGFANVYTFPPDVRYVARFRAAEMEARRLRRGLWQER